MTLQRHSWKWQLKHSLQKPSELDVVLKKSHQQMSPAVEQLIKEFRFAVTPHYLSLCDLSNPADPLLLQALPSSGELDNDEFTCDDPLNETSDAHNKWLIHRYPDRALLYVSHACAMYCRHCTRKRLVSHTENAIPDSEIASCIAYLHEHPQIRDVLISGGDPFMLSNKRLLYIIDAIRQVPSVEIIRVGTRVPVTLPQKITKTFALSLKRIITKPVQGVIKPLYVNMQFNHPKECSPESAKACQLLREAGCILGNQSVLLKGVNDDVQIFRELNKKLLAMGVRPYYVYLCDPVHGTVHFRTPVEKGLEIIDGLRGHTTGLATPMLVIDAPGGGGKILIPNNYVGRSVRGDTTFWKLVNFEGKFFYYAAPSDTTHYFARAGKQAPPSFAVDKAMLGLAKKKTSRKLFGYEQKSSQEQKSRSTAVIAQSRL